MITQQLAQVPRVRLVGLGVAPTTAQRGGIGRLTHMRDRTDPGQFLGHIPPTSTPLQRELHVLAAGEVLPQPAGQMHPVGRGDLATLHLPTDRIHKVERDLLPVDVQSSYDGHRDLLKLQGTRKRPVREWLTPTMMRLS